MIFIKSNSGYGLSCQDNHRMIIKRKNNIIEYIEPKDLIINEDKMQISNVNIWQKEHKECFMDPYLLGYMMGEKNNKQSNYLTITETYNNKCGKYSQIKHLPSEFIYYDDNTLLKIICGIIDNNAIIQWKDKKNKIISCICVRLDNEAIITQLIYILNKFNIKSNKSIINIKDQETSKLNYQTYNLIINPSNEDLQKYFCESIKCKNCIVTINRRKNIKNNKVKSINHILFNDNLDEYSYVYDLETEDHEYSANMIHIKNTGGASKIIYLTKEAPKLKGIIRQDNNTLLSVKNIRIILEYYNSDNIDEYTASIFKVEDMDTGDIIDIDFPADIIFSALNSSKLDSKSDTIILEYEPESIIGEINSEAVDATQNVRALQSTLIKAHQYNNDERGPRGLVEDLYNMFKLSSKIQLLHFEILVSQLIRDPNNPRIPYRYGSMKDKPIFIGIKKVPGLESVKRGVMFEQILDVVSKSLINDNNKMDPRIKSKLEDLFDM